jgi:trigger factor
MEVIESTSDGLKRELKVKIEAAELSRRLDAKLHEIKDNVRLKGFRPGKVPVDHLRKVYGRSMMAEIVQQTVAESSAKAVQDRDERPAVQPDISLAEDQKEIEQVMDGTADLSYTLSFEVLPKIEITDLKKLKLERPVAKISKEEVDEAIDKIAQDSTTFEDKDGAAKEGDQVVIDFEGSIDGVKFDGGAAEDAPVVIGRNQFIPGFEEGLIGAKKDEEREVKVSFPEDYPGSELAGKDAVFAVKVKSVGKPVKPAIDETFAKAIGFDSVEKLREGVEERIKEEYGRISRLRVKRELLDALDKAHKFELPGILVKQEFETIWRQVTGELERAGKSFEDEGTTEEKEKKKYEELAERRVRLGLVLAEIGEKSDVKITDDEVNNALMERLRQFPGQEQQVYEFYQKNPQALAELRAPIFEEKVVDYILELAEVKEKTVTKDELVAAAEEDDEDDL